MKTKPVSKKRIWYHYPYVMPASVLSAEPTHVQDHSSLRDVASTDGTCYLKVTRSFDDGTYLARVAAHPDRILTDGYTLVLSDAQLTLARPYDCRVMQQSA